jgi:hypothetical protein
MPAEVARLEAVLSAKTRDFDRSMDKSHSKMQTVGKAAGVAGLAIAAGLGAAAKIGFDEMVEGQKVTAQTNAVLKSTGSVANVTAKHVAELGTAIMKKSGIDDEAVKSGENMLLTFKNIRNEAGAGNKVFDEATKTLFDMSTALGTDASKSAIQLGKALNDPIKGISALARVGVTFTAAQKEQIKAMVESGNTMGAQKIILRELNSEFGGSAAALGKTLPGQINIAKESFKNIAGELVTGLLPAFTALTQKALAATRWLQEHPRLAKVLVIALGGLATALMAARAAQLLLNLAVLANPYVAAGAAIAALAAGLVYLQVKYQGVTKAVDFLKSHLYLLLAVPIVGWSAFLAAQIATHWRQIVSATQTMIAVLGRIKSEISSLWDAAKAPVNALVSAFRSLASAIGKVIDGIKWLISHIPHIPSLPHISVPNPFGDASGPPAFLGKGPASIDRSLYDELADATAHHLVLTSGYRPGAITKHGTKSDHSYYPSKAIDVAGAAVNMASFFRSLIGDRGVKQAFYDPLGSIFGGVLSSYREGGHSDHVHVATYDKGGWLKPGLTLAANWTGRAERVGGGGGHTYNITNVFPGYVGDESVVAGVVMDALASFQNRNGRPAYGSGF